MFFAYLSGEGLKNCVFFEIKRYFFGFSNYFLYLCALSTACKTLFVIFTMNKIPIYLIFGVILLLFAFPIARDITIIKEQSDLMIEPKQQMRNGNAMPSYNFRSTSTLLDYQWQANTTFHTTSNSRPYLSDKNTFYLPTITSNRKFASYSSHPITTSYGALTTNKHTNELSHASQANSPHSAIATQSRALTAQLHKATYIPFSAATPSEITAQHIDNQTQPAAIRGRQNGFPHPSDPDQSLESPVGEPRIMLIFAAAAAILITIRKQLQQQRISRDRRY